MSSDLNITVDAGSLVLQSVALRGLPGPDLRRLEYPTNLTLSALRAVQFDGTNLSYAEPDLMGGFVGVSVTSGTGQIAVVYGDIITDPMWNWLPGAIFVGPSGTLTQSPSGFSKEIARSIGQTKILVREGTLIKL